MTQAILTLDAALDGCSAAVVWNGVVLAEQRHVGFRGSAAVLPELARAVLASAGLDASTLAMVGVTVGPGSFTGVRAALALAQGIGLAAGVPVVGVAVTDAIRAASITARPVWVAVESRRDRIFLDTVSGLYSLGLDALPDPPGPVAVAGDAAIAVSSRLAAKGFDVQLLLGCRVDPLGIVLAAAKAERPAVPLYVDGVEATPGATARPSPT